MSLDKIHRLLKGDLSNPQDLDLLPLVKKVRNTYAFANRRAKHKGDGEGRGPEHLKDESRILMNGARYEHLVDESNELAERAMEAHFARTLGTPNYSYDGLSIPLGKTPDNQ